jgi:hypothetical protein
MVLTTSKDEFWPPSSPNRSDCVEQDSDSDGSATTTSTASGNHRLDCNMLGLMGQKQDKELTTEEHIRVLRGMC